MSLNNLGRVAFTAFDDDFTREAVFTGRGGALTEVANTIGDYSSFGFGGPSLNDLGRVAFQADLDDFASSGVFTGPDPDANAVIWTGDTIEVVRRGATPADQASAGRWSRASGKPRARSYRSGE